MIEGRAWSARPFMDVPGTGEEPDALPNGAPLPAQANPLQAAEARPVEIDPNGTSQIGRAERKVITVAVATTIDALKRSTIGSGSNFASVTRFGTTLCTSVQALCGSGADQHPALQYIAHGARHFPRRLALGDVAAGPCRQRAPHVTGLLVGRADQHRDVART
jgi:hypothetical protein